MVRPRFRPGRTVERWSSSSQSLSARALEESSWASPIGTHVLAALAQPFSGWKPPAWLRRGHQWWQQELGCVCEGNPVTTGNPGH